MILCVVQNKSSKAKDAFELGNKILENLPTGIKIIGTYWTLGKYDAVWIYEAPNEKEAMRLGINVGDITQTETLVALTREEATELLK